MGRQIDAASWSHGTPPQMYFDLEDRPCTVGRWAELFEERLDKGNAWKVGDTRKAYVDISTVWLGMNHGFGGGPPMIYETMIFGGSLDGWVDRYSTRGSARIGHADAVRKAFAWWRNPEYRILGAFVGGLLFVLGLVEGLR